MEKARCAMEEELISWVTSKDTSGQGQVREEFCA